MKRPYEPPTSSFFIFAVTAVGTLIYIIVLTPVAHLVFDFWSNIFGAGLS